MISLSADKNVASIDQQDDQIGRIFAYWAIVHFRQFFIKLASVGHILGYFFRGKNCELFFAKNGLGYILGYFFKLTNNDNQCSGDHLVNVYVRFLSVQ
jgi:hypothetical protein